MVTNRVLLLGGSGQIGQAMRRAALPSSWHLLPLTKDECNLLQPEAIGKAIQGFAPDLVINAAAMTDIFACEVNRDQAREINFHAVANIAGQCDTLNAPLIQLSTDYVFDGSDSARPYEPDDAMNPLNAYGQTKMMGEEAARHGLYWHVVLRTSLVFSAVGANILTRTLEQIDTQDEVEAVSDQISNPTSADAVAVALVTIADAILNGKGNGFGTFHLCGEPAVSRFEFLQAVMDAYAPYTARRPKLVAISSADQPARIPRPAYSSLDCEKIKRVYGIEQSPWREALARAVQEYKASNDG